MYIKMDLIEKPKEEEKKMEFTRISVVAGYQWVYAYALRQFVQIFDKIIIYLSFFWCIV
jgi:hypothetical protein